VNAAAPTPAIVADHPPPGRRPRILVVDDQELNQQLFAEILGIQGYETILAGNGPEAIETAMATDLDLILLDINMPGMNGLEVCRILRERPRTAAIPILIVTALSNRDQRLEGIAAGANDYLTKPVDRSDLLLRVRNAIQLSLYHRRLADQYDQLQRLAELRDGLVHMLIHDLRGPLTGIVFVLDAMREDTQALDHPRLAGDLETLHQQISRLTAMVSDVLDVNRAEAVGMTVRPERLDLIGLVVDAIALSGHARRSPPIELITPDGPVLGLGERDSILRVVANLVGNAVKFAGSSGVLRVTVSSTEDGPRVEVSDDGPGLAPAQQARVFDKFSRVETAKSRSGVGLGLTFCKLAVEANGGRIGVVSDPGQGATFWFTLPAVPAAPGPAGEGRFSEARPPTA
jgi:two-component system sensor histidine kinase/response regulator